MRRIKKPSIMDRVNVIETGETFVVENRDGNQIRRNVTAYQCKNCGYKDEHVLRMKDHLREYKPKVQNVQQVV